MEVTLSAALDAIEKNGLPKIRNQYLTYDNGKPNGGCAFGQGALNLNVDANDLCDLYYDFLAKLRLNSPSNNRDIVWLNDSTDLSLPEIAQMVRAELNDHLNDVMGEI